MAESYIPLSESFSTADAERPDIAYTSGELLVKFIDWRARRVALRFPDTISFRWQDAFALPQGVRDDSAYEVFDSAWICELRALDNLPQDTHHYMLYFNTAGVLNVVSGLLVAEV